MECNTSNLRRTYCQFVEPHLRSPILQHFMQHTSCITFVTASKITWLLQISIKFAGYVESHSAVQNELVESRANQQQGNQCNDSNL